MRLLVHILSREHMQERPGAKLGLRARVRLDRGPDLVLRLSEVDVDPLRLGAVEGRVDKELDAVALGVPEGGGAL